MGDPLETFKKVARKKPHKAEITCTNKTLVKGETRTQVLLLGKPQKTLINLYAQLTLLVWQLKEASL